MNAERKNDSVLEARIVRRAWRRVDIRLTIDDKIHLLRWRREWFADRLLLNERVAASCGGLWGRETVFGLETPTSMGARRLLFVIEPQPDWNSLSGSMAPRGVLLESDRGPLAAYGTLDPERRRISFEDMFAAAAEKLGLA